MAKRVRTTRTVADRAAEAEARLRLERANAGRRMLKQALSGSYKQRDRLRYGTPPGGGAAQVHRDRWSLERLRRDCQELMRKNPLARAMVAQDQAMTVADGFTLQCQSDDPDWNEEAEAKFNEWADNEADITGTRSLDDIANAVVYAWDVDGDMAALMTNRGSLQCVEAERIVSPSGPGAMDSRTLSQGVQMDLFGRPVTFHVGEWRDDFGSVEYQTTPVAAEHVLWLPNPMANIPGAVRGEPQLCATIDRFERIERYSEAVTVAAQMAAMTALVIKHSNPGGMAAALSGEDIDNSLGDTERHIDWKPAGVMELANGDDVEQIDPKQPTANYWEFVKAQVAQIAVDLGLPYLVAMLDASEGNLANTRAVVELASRRVWRKQYVLQRRFYSPVYRWKVGEWVDSGELREPSKNPESWRKHEFTPPPRPVMDPLTELQAATLARDSRFKSRKRIVAEMTGQPFRQLNAELKAEIDDEREQGIEPITKPGAAVGGGLTDDSDGSVTDPSERSR